jgi:hypothetical protein
VLSGIAASVVAAVGVPSPILMRAEVVVSSISLFRIALARRSQCVQNSTLLRQGVAVSITSACTECD